MTNVTQNLRSCQSPPTPTFKMASKKLPVELKGFLYRAADFLNGLLFHIPICYKLGLKLFKSLSKGTWIWMIMAVRLVIFSALLIPGWIGMVKYWLFSVNIVRNVEYGQGARKRNLLDIYLPIGYANGDVGAPVVIFVTGGAWIIGYKLWCALIGRTLSSMGVLTIVPDYRNFPQGDIEDMISDITAAVKWVSNNALKHGGDPEKIVLAGQSAGAHICMCALVDSLTAKIIDSQKKRCTRNDMQDGSATTTIVHNNDNNKDDINTNSYDNTEKNNDDDNHSPHNRKVPKENQKISSHRNNSVNGHDVLQNKFCDDEKYSHNNGNNENKNKRHNENVLNTLLSPVSTVGKQALFPANSTKECSTKERSGVSSKATPMKHHENSFNEIQNKEEEEKKTEEKILFSSLRIDIGLNGEEEKIQNDSDDDEVEIDDDDNDNDDDNNDDNNDDNDDDDTWRSTSMTPERNPQDTFEKNKCNNLDNQQNDSEYSKEDVIGTERAETSNLIKGLHFINKIIDYTGIPFSPMKMNLIKIGKNVTKNGFDIENKKNKNLINNDTKTSHFFGFESPGKFKEISDLVSKVLKNVSAEIKDQSVEVRKDVTDLYFDMRDKVNTVMADLNDETNELKELNVFNDKNDNSGKNNNSNTNNNNNNDNKNDNNTIVDKIDLNVIKLFIGISGPYNLLSLSAHMQNRGLDHSILKWICRNDVKKYSPVTSLGEIMSDLNIFYDTNCNNCYPNNHDNSNIDENKNNNEFSENGNYSKTFPTNIQNNDSTFMNNKDEKCNFRNPPASVKNYSKRDKDEFHVVTDSENLFLKIPEVYTGTAVEDFSPPKNTDYFSESPLLLSSSVQQQCKSKSEDVELKIQGVESVVHSPRRTLIGWGFPPVALFHGAKDISVPASVSVEMAAAICRWGGEVFLRMYEGWAHTDPILEGPLSGDITLCRDIVMQINRIFPTPYSSTTPSPHSLSSSIPVLSPLPSSLPSLPSSLPPSLPSSVHSSQPFFLPTHLTQSPDAIPINIHASNGISPKFANATSYTTSIPINGTSISHSVLLTETLSSHKNCNVESKNMRENKNESKNKIQNEKFLSEIESVHSSILKNELCVSTACPMCSLHYDVDHVQSPRFNEIRNDGTVKSNHEMNLEKNNTKNDTKMNKELKSSENSSFQQHIEYVFALPVIPNKLYGNNKLAQNIPEGSSASYCQCHESQMKLNVRTRTNPGNADRMDEGDIAVTAESEKDNLKKRGVGVRGCNITMADQLIDCHVPKICVQLARYVNPF